MLFSKIPLSRTIGKFAWAIAPNVCAGVAGVGNSNRAKQSHFINIDGGIKTMSFTIEQTTTENYYILVELETRANIDFLHDVYIVRVCPKHGENLFGYP